MVLNRRRLLRYVEYAAVSASVAGAIAAVTTRQIIYGVAPLSVAVALNLASRRQWETQIEQQLTQTTAQVGQQFDRLAQRHKLIEQRLKALSQQPTSDLPQSTDLQALREESSHLIQAWRMTFRATAESSPAGYPFQLEAVSTELRQLQQSLAALEALNLESRFQSLEALPLANSPTVAPWSQPIGQLGTDLNQLKAQVTQLRQDVDRLETLLRASPPVSKETVEPPARDQPPSDVQWVPPQLPLTQDFTLEINLGIDFGTAFTKVCFRDLASDLSEIVTFAETDRVELEQALLSTKVAILEDGTLLTGLTAAEWAQNLQPIQRTIDFIKMRLAHLDLPEEAEWRLDQVPELNNSETVENICAYFLSNVITRAQEWIQHNRAEIFKNQKTRWAINIGVPVPYCDPPSRSHFDSPSRRRFREVLSLAWLLANTPSSQQPLTINSLNQLGTYLRQWKQKNKVESLDCFTTPEIAAEIWSFLSSRKAEDGKLYTFFDFGDGTLDGAAFRFFRENEGEPRVDFYKSQVRPLGVTAFTQQLASELQATPGKIRQVLLDWQPALDNDLCRNMNASQTRRQIKQLVAAVVIGGRNNHRQHRGTVAKDELGDQLHVFVSGGGCYNPFLIDTVQSTHADFNQQRSSVPPYHIRQIPVSGNLVMNGLASEEFHRFAVAYGLCVPELCISEKDQMNEIRLPNQVDIQEHINRQWGSDIARYEDTRDLM
ncbi:hypothetical protein HC928_12435 [bacterium]|nr:hypothetical protein [bacterium]